MGYSHFMYSTYPIPTAASRPAPLLRATKSNQIQALQIHVTQNRERALKLTWLRKSAVGTFYMYLVLLICFLPQYCSLLSIFSTGSNAAVDIPLLYTWTLLFLNSSLNPLIYCWKMRSIRRSIMKILLTCFQARVDDYDTRSGFGEAVTAC